MNSTACSRNDSKLTFVGFFRALKIVKTLEIRRRRRLEEKGAALNIKEQVDEVISSLFNE